MGAQDRISPCPSFRSLSAVSPGAAVAAWGQSPDWPMTDGTVQLKTLHPPPAPSMPDPEY